MAHALNQVVAPCASATEPEFEVNVNSRFKKNQTLKGKHRRKRNLRSNVKNLREREASICRWGRALIEGPTTSTKGDLR